VWWEGKYCSKYLDHRWREHTFRTGLCLFMIEAVTRITLLTVLSICVSATSDYSVAMTAILHCDVMLTCNAVVNFSDIYKLSGLVTSFQQIIDNLFTPLFEVTNDPASHPELHCFLYYVSRFAFLCGNFELYCTAFASDIFVFCFFCYIFISLLAVVTDRIMCYNLSH